MKKFLSLVMALVMVMSLTVVGASAKDFTDSDTITYDEAIDVISALEVVDGYTDGSFQPNTELNRGQAAKIICNLILGVAAADNLAATAAPFPDVPASHHFAGYISYCAQEGIISGYADGYFRPNNTLTGYAFMKMLLGALGYDQNNEGLVGTNWSIQVAKLVQGIGLDADLEGDFVGSKNVTRQEACLYALNTLKARTVEYKTPGSSITVNGVEITQKASNATYRTYEALVQGTNADNTDGNIYTADGYIQFAEEHFPRLVLNNSERDSFQRPSHMWTYKGDKIGEYVDTPDVSYEGTVTMADIYSDLNLTSTTDDFVLYIDGMYAKDFYPVGNPESDYYDAGPDYVAITEYDDQGDPVYGGMSEDGTVITIDKSTISNDMLIGTGPGSTIECYKTGVQNGYGTIVVINTYIGEVISINEAEGKHPANVEIAPLGDDVEDAVQNGTMAGDAFLSGVGGYSDTFETTKFDVGDIVTFNYAGKPGKTGASIKNVALAETVEGEVKDFTDQESFNLDGTEYSYSKMATQKVTRPDIGTNIVAYLDTQGNVLYFDEGADNINNYALIMDAGRGLGVGSNSFMAELLFADGHTALVSTDKRYGAAECTDPTGAIYDDGSDDTDNCAIGQWVMYRVDSNGRYVLTMPAVREDRTVTNMLATDHTAETTGLTAVGAGDANTAWKIGDVSSDSASAVVLDNDTIRVNSSTVIIVKTKDDTFKVYNGVKELPEIIDAGNGTGTILYSAMTRLNQTYAKFLYVDASSNEVRVRNRTNTDLFLVARNVGNSANANGNYYSFAGVVNGTPVNRVNLNWDDPDTQKVITHLLGGKGNDVTVSTYSVSDGLYEVRMEDELLYSDRSALAADPARQNGVSSDTYWGLSGVITSIDRITGTVIEINGGDTYDLAEGCKFFRVDDTSTNYRVVESTWKGLAKGDVNSGTNPRYSYVGISLNRDYEVTAIYWRMA